MKSIPENDAKQRIAWRIAQEFNKTECPVFINLGVGIPTMVADHITNSRVYIQAENGMLGLGPAAPEEEPDLMLINAGRIPVTETPGCSFFDSCTSFGMIRGNHVDATVIGAFEVDEEGNVANWIIPNGKQLGVGGAMDLVTGARQVFIAMTHTTRKGEPKIVRSCGLPVTGYGEVDLIVTEFAVFHFREGRLFLQEIAPEVTIQDLREMTSGRFEVSGSLVTMAIPEPSGKTLQETSDHR
ncbi:MAG: 3-oxoacid CoA-transferase subunit B [Thermovirgaceae bacterium]|nr:3-oxoacid CoA-transferase subunit B [Thermovirgaceae bacterium]